MNYSFDIKDAEEYGVEAAVMLYNIKYWVFQNKAKGKNLHDGDHWTYNSAEAFSKLFPFWTPRKIARILSKLEEKGAIVSGNYNKMSYDRTKWYTLSKTLGHIEPTHLSDLTNRFVDSVQPIPDVNTDNKNTDKVIDLPFNSEEFKSTWKQWVQYRIETKNKLTPRSIIMQFNKFEGFNEKECIEAIELAIASGYKAIFPKKNNKQQTSTPQTTFRI